MQGRYVHLNNGGLSPISLPVRQEIDHWSMRYYEDGFHSDADYKKRIEWSRSQVAKLVDCDADEVAFFQSCAWGISQFAFGIELQKDDEVLLFEQEYSSNLYPWQAACKKAGAKLIILKSDQDLSVSNDTILKNITAKTKAITISWVEFQTGAVFDLEMLAKICKEKNILFFVDAAQALGMHDISFKNLGIDGLASSSHKWLNAPVGVGFLAIKRELAVKMQPIGVGARTFGDCDDPSALECIPKLNALKFEAGSMQAIEINALGKSIELIKQVGPSVLRAEAFRFAGIIRAAIEKKGFKIHTPFEKVDSTQFINFSAMKDNKSLQEYFYKAGIHLPVRGPGLRVTPHAINSENDIQKFIEVLNRI